MIKRTIAVLFLIISFLTSTNIVSAATKNPSEVCNPSVDGCTAGYSCQPIDSKTYACQKITKSAGEVCDPSLHKCESGYSCKQADEKTFLCQKSTATDVFGQIKPPVELIPFLNKGGSGAGGISLFLSNLVLLIYSLASIVLIFMLLWGAFDWMTSAGDKEKLQNAQRKILNAIIGIILFAVTFAAINVLETFTGFKFFNGQGISVTRDDQGHIIKVVCSDGYSFYYGDLRNPSAVCQNGNH